MRSTLAYQPYPTAPFHGGPSVLSRITKRVHRAYEAYRYRKDLESIPDWILCDIGVPRSEIDREVDRHLDAEGRPIGGYPF